MTKVTIKIVCENDKCKKCGEVINEVSRECDTEEKAENGAELFIDNFGGGSEDDADYCPECKDLGIAQEPEYEEVAAPKNKKPAVKSIRDDDDDDDDYSTTCPYCKLKGCLSIVHLTADTYITLEPDGFSTEDVKLLSTSDEIVCCQECHKEFSLSEVMR